MRYPDCMFSPEALEIFKKIVLSCTDTTKLLQILELFFRMKSPVTLENTKEFVPVGSQIILDYLQDYEKIISVEDVLMAFASTPHYKQMCKIYNTKTNDFWIENYQLEEYLISHLIMPVSIVRSRITRIKGNSALAQYYNPKINLKLIGIKNFGRFNSKKIYFVHFGLAVYETEDKVLAKKIMEAQKQYMENLNKNPFRIIYAHHSKKKLKDIYERNILFYLSLKNTA